MRRRFPPHWKKRFFTWPISGVMTWFLYYLMLILPIDLGSAIVGKLFRFLGPQLPINKRAKTHIKSSFPQREKNEIEATIRHLWENLGSTTAEFPHIQKLVVSGYD